jgi:multimeric flavodoxin WrbA
MKIVAVFGSPRKGGNSDTLAEVFLQEAEGIGAEVERFRLKELKYGGCIACNSCKTKSETCVLKDDLIPVLEAVREAETLLVATPVYFFDMPSQVKAFMDRWYSFFKPNYFARKDISRLPSGKNVIFVTSQRAPESLFMDFIQRYNYMLKLFGFKRMHLIRGCKLGDDLDDADKREDLLEKARETASKVLAGEPSDAHIPPYSRQGDKAET